MNDADDRPGGACDGAAQVGEEVREALAAFLTAVTPLVAQISPGPGAPQSSCTWCPVCALVALSRGEQHPLLTALGTQGVALLTALRDMLADSMENHTGAGHPGGAAADGAHGRPPADSHGADGDTGDGGAASADQAVHASPRFETIPVVIDVPDAGGTAAGAQDPARPDTAGRHGGGEAP